ncbi:MAG TPA: protein kinase [Phycisphaerae bacterium]|nr:protein kinase [Phycisphaerae bacterium]
MRARIMDGFRYKHGDRPLEGYTIQRAVGRGGFGEVYFSVSDAGREVALKAVQGHEQIELRGVSACMNLKSPHLVTIFDVRYNADSVPFVIMEYVSGPSLRELLDGSPAGLGAQKAAFFLREIAKGLTYLHDRGVVHRDLKPGNIFYEDGYVKIGDYGLSKAMAASRHSGQTITVGTVHYMAPEIGQGRYDASIDVYALGCVLYEMLTGQTPFLGGSPGEILMKHLTAEPGLTGIEEPFATVIRKAMAKEPADRYRSAQEMVEAVFGTEHIRNSVSHFSPDSLTMVADRVARTVTVGGGSSAEANRLGGEGGLGTGPLPAEPWDRISARWQKAGRRLEKAGERFSRRMQQVGERFAGRSAGVAPAMAPVATPTVGLDAAGDPLTWNQRRLLAVMTAFFVAVGTGALTENATFPLQLFWSLLSFVLITAAAGGVISTRVLFSPAIESEPLLGRLVYGMLGCAHATLFLMVAFVAYCAGLQKGHSGEDMIAILPVVLLLVGGVSLGIMAIRGRARNGRAGVRNELSRATYVIPLVVATYGLGLQAAFMNGLFFSRVSGTLLACGIVLLLMNWRKLTSPQRRSRISLRWAIIAGFLGLILGEACNGAKLGTAGVMAGMVLVAQILAPFSQGAAAAFGAASTGVAAMGATASPGRRPMSSPFSPRPQGTGAAAAPHKPVDGLVALTRLRNCSDRLRGGALMLACVGFVFPLAGLHRFYVGKIGTGLLWLCTFGFLHIGTIIDIIFIATGTFRDKQGRRLAVWWNMKELEGMSPPPPAVAAAEGILPLPAARSSARLQGIRDATLSFFGGLLMLAALAVGLAAAFNLPAIVALGWPDRNLAAELHGLFGYSGWPQLLLKAFWASFAVLIVLSTLLGLIARRERGCAHVFRLALGAVAMFAAVQSLSDALARENWPLILDMFDQHRAGPAIETFLDAVASREATVAAVLFLAALLLFVWPARSRPLDASNSGGQGVSS